MAITPVLKITDGVTSVSFLEPESARGVHLDNWIPEISNYKGGGIRRNNSRADGQALVGKQWENVTEEFRVLIDGYDQDAVMRTLQDLRRLFEKASDYWTAPQQDAPVWIEASGSCETETRYSVIVRGHMPQDGNPHSQPFFATDPSVLDDEAVLVSIERQPWWTSEQPGSEVCAQASAQQKGWDRIYWESSTGTVGQANDALELSTGWLLFGETNGAVGEVQRTQNGAIWLVATVPPTAPVYGLAEQGAFVYCITSGGCFRSGDNGDNWALRNGNIVSTGVNSIIAATDGYLYVSGTLSGVNGIHRSNDGGTTWATVYTSDAVDDGAMFETTNGYIYAGESAMVRSANGTAWTVVLTLPANRSVRSFLENAGYILAAVQDTSIDKGYIYRTTSGAAVSWGLVVSLDKRVTDLAVSATYDGIIVTQEPTVGSVGIYYGLDDGTAWKELSISGSSNLRAIAYFSTIGVTFVGGLNNIYNEFFQSFATVGRDKTCSDEVFFTNHNRIAQLTDVLRLDASGPTVTSILGAALPSNLLPSPFAAGDAVHFVIDDSILDTGPFFQLTFDIGQTLQSSGSVIRWEYSRGGGVWGVLNVTDETAATYPFEVSGVGSVVWLAPLDWASNTVGGISGLMVRVHVVSLGTFAQTPQQQNRRIYTVNWSRVDVDSTQVLGDIPALLRIRAHNRSDLDQYTTYSELDLQTSRIVVGLRSLGRGAAFVASVNLADRQNQEGITVDATGAGSTFATKLNTPSGRMIVHDVSVGGSAGLANYIDAATITFSPSVSFDYYGTYHAFLRAQLIENTGTPVPDADAGVQIRLEARTGTGGIQKPTKHRRFVGWDQTGETFKDWQLLSFGRIDLPVSDLLSAVQQPDQFQIVVQVSASSALALDVNAYDLWLIPVDEWALDTLDVSLTNLSAAGVCDQVDIDSVTFPKRRIRSQVSTADSDEFVRATYQVITPGPAILQANADQRLWFLTARAAYRGEQTGAGSATILQDSYADFLRAGVRIGMLAYNEDTGNSAKITAVARQQITTASIPANWGVGDNYLIICNNVYKSEPWNTHSVQLTANHRYLSFRGDR